MREKEKRHGWAESKVLFRLFVLSCIALGHQVHSRSHSSQVEPSTGVSRQKFQIHVPDNRAVYDGSVGFDKILHWVFNEDLRKGERTFAGKSFRLKLGERFAFRKRLQFALLPIMYKMGVMTTLLTGLTVLVLKGLTIGVILLIFAFGNYFTKLHKASHQSAQPIHVHVHSQDGHKVSSYPSVAGPWDRVADEIHPSAYLGDEEIESYRRRLIENSAAMIKLKSGKF